MGRNVLHSFISKHIVLTFIFQPFKYIIPISTVFMEYPSTDKCCYILSHNITNTVEH